MDGRRSCHAPDQIELAVDDRCAARRQLVRERRQRPPRAGAESGTESEQCHRRSRGVHMRAVHAALDACLGDTSRLPLERVRCFFETTQQQYRADGYMGCLLGGVGQELSGVSEVFRRKIEGCFSELVERLAVCLEEARQRGDIPADFDARHIASLLVDCWEGAALRSRLRRDAAPLDAMLDFYFRSVAAT
jgi:TetR/AcrR family transcriptional repressor of nem operon